MEVFLKDMMELPVCHLKQERETGDTCPTDPLFEAHPAAPRNEAYPNTSGTGSENQAPERSGFTMKEEPEYESLVPMNEADFMVKEESVDSNESWLDKMKQERISPLAMDTLSEEPDEEDDHDVYVKRKLNKLFTTVHKQYLEQRKQQMQSRQNWLPHWQESCKEFVEDDSKLSLIECSTSDCCSQTGSSSPQPLSGEVTAMNSQNHLTRNSSSEHETEVLPSLETKKPFAVASCSSADDAMKEQKAADAYLLKRHVVQQVAGDKQDRHSYQSGSRCSPDHEEDCLQSAMLQFSSLKSSTGKKRFNCSLCGKTFKAKQHFTTHMRIHTGDKPYKCSQCGKSFADSSNLTKHMRQHTGVRPYKCSLCGKSFTVSGHLTNHMQLHTGEQPYKCSLCGDSFTRNGTLTTHLRLHTGERPYKCSQCEESFISSSYLSTHMHVHTGERPYKCSQCGKSFTRSSSLTTHMRLHTGERPYNCPQCEESFAHSFTLTTHMRKHTGERPYKCSQCGKSFTRSGHLIRHMRKH